MGAGAVGAQLDTGIATVEQVLQGAPVRTHWEIVKRLQAPHGKARRECLVQVCRQREGRARVRQDVSVKVETSAAALKQRVNGVERRVAGGSSAHSQRTI